MCVCTRINAQLSVGNSSSCSSDAYIQHGSKTEQTTLKREERGVLVPANCTTITSNVLNTMKSVNTHKERDDSMLTVRKTCVACEIWVNSQGKMSSLTQNGSVRCGSRNAALRREREGREFSAWKGMECDVAGGGARRWR